MAPVIVVTTVFPTQDCSDCSNNSAHELTQTMFRTENAGLLSKSAVVAPGTYASPVVGGVQGGHGNAHLQLGAVRALRTNAP